ncbi:hypothetical protein NBRC116583_22290 [Arenicella sp. 4NH20-0111]|uniref:TIGR01244 family sulfur transferase n=1 Tax=Arenicella sp. 4NH20-0111 TaxID=3127648 RepID=UPI003109FF5E
MKILHKNLLVAGQITAEDFKSFNESGITTIINNRPDGEEPGQLPHVEAESLANEHGINYIYLPMANGQPLGENTVGDFRKALLESDGNVLAHCRSGMRSSFIWALGAISDGEVTVEDSIKAAQTAGIPLQNARSVLESVRPQT